jgi:superfamily I DNA/RNA helicase
LYEDDLPKFLTTISLEQLEELLDNISNNMVDYEDSKIKFYTVHSYKGMEDNNVRMANDITIDNKNIYYVGITRGMDKILIDN